MTALYLKEQRQRDSSAMIATSKQPVRTSSCLCTVISARLPVVAASRWSDPTFSGWIAGPSDCNSLLMYTGQLKAVKQVAPYVRTAP